MGALLRFAGRQFCFRATDLAYSHGFKATNRPYAARPLFLQRSNFLGGGGILPGLQMHLLLPSEAGERREGLANLASFQIVCLLRGNLVGEMDLDPQGFCIELQPMQDRLA